MEQRNSRVWIVLVAVLVALCCCLVVAGAAVAGWFFTWPPDWLGPDGFEGDRIERTFSAGGDPWLNIDNFAGSVTVRAGESGEIRVVAIKKAPSFASLDRVEIQMSERQGGLEIKTHKSAILQNASVRLEISAPPGTRLDLHTGAGSVEVSGLGTQIRVDSGAGSITLSDLSGNIYAHTGAGSIDLRNASGTAVDLDTGAGSIHYEGELAGECRFETGAGSITLRLPAGLDMEVDLDTGTGTVDVGYAVDGQVTKREVRGVVGDGSDGRIYAHTGTGSIDLVRR